MRITSTSAQTYFDYHIDSPMNALLTGGGHLYNDEWFTESPATLSSPGVEYRHCTICSNGKQTRPIPQLTVSGYTAGELSQVAAEAEALAGDTFSDPIQMAVTAYENALGTTVFQYTTALEMLDDVIDSENTTANTGGALSGMLVPHLYGGLDIKKGFLTDNDRARLILEDYLAAGDIIVAEYDDISHVFLYIGNGTLLQASSSGVCALVTITGDEYTSSNILVTLLSYDRYAILRPSMTV